MGDLARYFSRSEFACRCGCGLDTVDAELLEVLVDLRSWAGGAVQINSGCRCPAHNRRVGGSTGSQHLYCRAADIVVSGKTPDQVADYLDDLYSDRYGLGRYNTFTHIDTRTAGPARWDLRSG